MYTYIYICIHIYIHVYVLNGPTIFFATLNFIHYNSHQATKLFRFD